MTLDSVSVNLFRVIEFICFALYIGFGDAATKENKKTSLLQGWLMQMKISMFATSAIQRLRVKGEANLIQSHPIGTENSSYDPELKPVSGRLPAEWV